MCSFFRLQSRRAAFFNLCPHLPGQDGHGTQRHHDAEQPVLLSRPLSDRRSSKWPISASTFLSMCKSLHAVRKKCYLPALRPSTHDPSTRSYVCRPVARDRARLPVEIVRLGQATRAKRQVDKDIAFPPSSAQRLRSDIRGPLGPCR